MGILNFRLFKVIVDIFRFVFTVIVIAYLLASTKRFWYTRVFFWPLFVLSSLFVTMPIYFIGMLLTLWLPSNFFVLHFGDVYPYHYGIKYEYSIDILFWILLILGVMATWKIVFEYEFQLYKSNSTISVLERIFGFLFGVFILFQLFNLTSSPIHKEFFLDTFEYYSKNPFLYDE